MRSWGRRKSYFNELRASAIGNAGIDHYTLYNRCIAKKVMKNILVYAVRKNGKAEGYPCVCVWAHLGGGSQCPICLLGGPCTSFLMERPRGNVDAGFQVIQVFVGPPSVFCLKGLEAWGVFQKGTDKDLMPFPVVSCLQRYGFTLLPLLHRGGRIGKGTASLGPGLCWAKLAVQSRYMWSSFQFKVIGASQPLLQV